MAHCCTRKHHRRGGGKIGGIRTPESLCCYNVSPRKGRTNQTGIVTWKGINIWGPHLYIKNGRKLMATEGRRIRLAQGWNLVLAVQYRAVSLDIHIPYTLKQQKRTHQILFKHTSTHTYVCIYTHKHTSHTFVWINNYQRKRGYQLESGGCGKGSREGVQERQRRRKGTGKAV